MPAFDIIVRRRNAGNTGTEEFTVPYVSGSPLSFDANGFPVGSGATIKVAKVTLTNAQILALATTDVTIIAAPGAGKAIIPLRALVTSDIAEVYSGIDNDCTIGFTPAGLLSSLLNHVGESLTHIDDLLAAQGRLSFALLPARDFASVVGASQELDPANIENIALKLTTNNDANFEDGDAANTLTVTVWYVEADVPVTVV